MTEALRVPSEEDAYRIYYHYFTKTWQPLNTSSGAHYVLRTNLSWEQLVARPVGPSGRDTNGRIAPFKSNDALWKFVKSYSREVNSEVS